jgi:hypothetical protein
MSLVVVGSVVSVTGGLLPSIVVVVVVVEELV